MGFTSWFRSRKTKDAFSRALSEHGRLFYLMNYDGVYAAVVDDGPTRARKLAELFFFRFWLTQFALRLCKPEGVADDEILGTVIPNGITLGIGMFERVHGVSTERALGDGPASLMEARFQAYDAAFLAGRTADDPFAQAALADALASRILHRPSQETVAYFKAKISKQIGEALGIWM